MINKSPLDEVIEMADRIYNQGPLPSTIIIPGPPGCTLAKLPKPSAFPTGRFRVRLVNVDTESQRACYRVPTNPTVTLEIEITAFNDAKGEVLLGLLDDETVVDLMPEPKLDSEQHQVGWMRPVDSTDLLDYLVGEEAP